MKWPRFAFVILRDGSCRHVLPGFEPPLHQPNIGTLVLHCGLQDPVQQNFMHLLEYICQTPGPVVNTST
jgi:hypothetical protein